MSTSSAAAANASTNAAAEDSVDYDNDLDMTDEDRVSHRQSRTPPAEKLTENPQELEAMKARVREMEAEAAKLREMQAVVSLGYWRFVVLPAALTS